MKKTLFILPLLALTACDNTTISPETCIDEITQIVYCTSSNCDSLYIKYNGQHHNLTPENAMKISRNWTPTNMHLYRNDGTLQEHEKDACKTLERLHKYIYETGLENADIIRKAMDTCGDECATVLTTGEHGDFLIRIPENDELRKIASGTKTVKFLSAFNLNSYARAGHCLINIIPYKTFQEMGIPSHNCHYRIYCGAPEYMNYNEYYAVEVCG